jgi:hypothetical protein
MAQRRYAGRREIVGKRQLVPRAVGDLRPDEPQQADQQARAVARLQVDDQVVGAARNLSQPADRRPQLLAASAQGEREHAAQARVRGIEPIPWRQRAEVDLRIGKGAGDILQRGAGKRHIPHRAPFDHQDPTDAIPPQPRAHLGHALRRPHRCWRRLAPAS